LIDQETKRWEEEEKIAPLRRKEHAEQVMTKITNFDI